ncbi:MBL fold metallo-hydrolase [Chitinivorax sp. B]|uniref:MBL fold metallo-hydrolase n=1 Tax=Chitinivorax sp. B TaxID=2502235 RepID=UPI0014858F1A|nr:MBL fold metallo-hydrolase [Chitinivorax sp. B]
MRRSTYLIGCVALLASSTLAWAKPQGCPTTGVYVQVLGSGGPELTGRAQSSYLIWDHGRSRVLIDAGPGSAVNFGRVSARFEMLEAIALTHLHTDHSADLPAYVKAGFFGDRSRDLPVLGPDGSSRFPPTSEWLKSLLGMQGGAYRYLERFVSGDDQASYQLRPQDILPEGEDKMPVLQQDRLQLTAASVAHGAVPALAWRVDIGEHAVVFSGDTNGNGEALIKLTRGAGLLVAHNAVPEGAQGVERALHMPPSRIGEIASLSKVQHLLLSHRMQRTLGQETTTTRTIRHHYQGKLQFANDLDCVPIPRRTD